MAHYKKWCIYVTFCCKVWKTTSKTQEPKSVFLVMTQEKKSSSHLSGKACPLHIWIKPSKSGQNITGMFVTYFYCEGAVHQYLSLKAKMLTRITTERFCNLWRKKSTINAENNSGTRTARLTMTMHCHKMLCQCNNSEMLETRLPPPPLIVLIWHLGYLKFSNKPWMFYIWPKIHSLSSAYSSSRNTGVIA